MSFLMSCITLVLLNLVGHVVDSLIQDKGSLFERIASDENSKKTLQNSLSCCGMVAYDGIVRHLPQDSQACKPVEGFSTKPYPHCNYVIGELIMKRESTAYWTLAPITLLFAIILTFACQWIRKCSAAMKMQGTNPYTRQYTVETWSKGEQMPL